MAGSYPERSDTTSQMSILRRGPKRRGHVTILKWDPIREPRPDGHQSYVIIIHERSGINVGQQFSTAQDGHDFVAAWLAEHDADHTINEHTPGLTRIAFALPGD